MSQLVQNYSGVRSSQQENLGSTLCGTGAIACSMEPVDEVRGIIGDHNLRLCVHPNGCDEGALRDFARGKECCRLHVTVRDVVGIGVGIIPGGFPKHKAIAAAFNGDRSCHVGESTLRLDRKLAALALDWGARPLAYLTSKEDPFLRKFKTGSVQGMACFGRGYCYLLWFPPVMRMRLARILGPCPKLYHVWLLFRVCGVSKVYAELKAVSQEYLHLYETPVAQEGVAVASSVLRVLDKYPDICIGYDEREVQPSQGLDTRGLVFDEHQSLTREKMVAVMQHVSSQPVRPIKVLCDVCGFMVNPEGHEQRCAVRGPSDPRAQFLGDAIHAVDVKVLVVLTHDQDYTIRTQPYISAKGQRAYMEEVLGRGFPRGSSDRTVSNTFEREYHGCFRHDYLMWLGVQLQVPESVVRKYLRFTEAFASEIDELYSFD